MTPRTLRLLLPLAALVALVALLALAACGGDGEPGVARPGQLTDPRDVPTASPWVEPPEVIILPLEPGAPNPITGGSPGGGGEENGGEDGGDEGGGATPGECGDEYVVQQGDYPGLIAEKCGVTLEALLEANPDIEPTNLHIGDVLKIPR